MRYFILFAFWATSGLADPPSIEAVTYSNGRFDVTLKHPDTGWDHYADGWEVQTWDGTVLGYRKLHHPHVNEQPFTRSLGGVSLPEGTTEVRVRSHCNDTGWSDFVTVKVTP
ncbi:hypothetical protein [Algirhabdus cladophorae]|uniref:hypothetical protein n=1 Tax=Algirhabdus cladophorae TaxID=3377108 RepID=UPI003B84B5F1